MSGVLLFSCTLLVAVSVSGIARRSVLSTAVFLVVGAFAGGFGLLPDDVSNGLVAELAATPRCERRALRTPASAPEDCDTGGHQNRDDHDRPSGGVHGRPLPAGRCPDCSSDVTAGDAGDAGPDALGTDAGASARRCATRRA